MRFETPTAPDPGADRPTGPVLTLVSARRHRWPGHPGRRVIRYTVRPGDTATGLAVRFHAWTDELRAINHLGRRSALYTGERIRIPVVVAAARRHGHQAGKPHGSKAQHRPKVRQHQRHARPKAHPTRSHRSHRPWMYADASRAKVRRVIVRAARKHGVNPHLALAIAWQESGWQQRQISSAHAIGVMQVLPGTARWMSLYTERRLNPYGLYDNVTVGVVLIKVLKSLTHKRGHAVAAYYQGLGAVQEHGLYRSTKAYVKNVVALRKRMAHGWNPG